MVSPLAAQEHRTQSYVQEALQEALLRVTDRSFDVRIIELLLMHGAKVSATLSPTQS